MSRTPLRRAVAALLALTLLGGCATAAPADPPVAVATPPADCAATAGPLVIAQAVHANVPAPALPPTVAALLRTVVAVPAGTDGPPVSLVAIDGRPWVSAGPQAFRSDAGNDEALAADRDQFVASVAATAVATRANTAEVDDLAGVDLAARTVHASSATGTVAFVDAGLPTTGPLDFRRPGLLDADPADVVAALRAQHALPDLTGLTVLAFGIGDTAAPQVPLDLARQTRLRELWTALLTASGATCVSVNPWPRTGASAAGLPPVGVVPVPAPPVIDLTTATPTVLPDDSTVGFRPGLDVLRDPRAAAEVLRPVAALLAADPARRLDLTGTTARWGADAGQVDLSLRRARTVARLLADLGAPADRITTHGVGSHFPGYQPDQGPDGTLLPGPAAHNRTVILTPATT
jgi:outer membrane protein OmpA-like peptidoglycan-associated protein